MQKSIASITQIESASSIAPKAYALWRYTSLFALVLLLWCATSSPIAAQDVQFTQGDVGSGLEKTLQIPLRAYPGRGQASLPITLYYSSKVWRFRPIQSYDEGQGYFSTILAPKYAEHSVAGWTNSFGVPQIEWPEDTDVYSASGRPICPGCHTPPLSPANYWRVARLYIHMPDGSTHELRKSDQPYQSYSIITTGTFYAVDGSRLRYDGLDETNPFYLPDGSTATGVLYLPDGARYILGSSCSQFIDRNGNTLNFSAATGQWADTLGRALAPPPLSRDAGDYNYDLPGVNGATNRYVLRWRYLSDVLTDSTQQVRYLSDYSLTGAPSATNVPQPINSPPYLFNSDFGDGVGYVVGPPQSFNPVVLYQVEFPNGSNYTFTYNVYGEIDKIVYPTGAYERDQYQAVRSVSSTGVPYSQANRGITTRWVSAMGAAADEVPWQYQAGWNETYGTYVVTTTAPDNTRTERLLSSSTKTHGRTGPYYPFGYEDARAGTTYEERVYSASNQMLRRKLRSWAVSSAVVNTGGVGAINATVTRNPRVTKEVSLILDTGDNNPALAKTVTYGYDNPSANEFTTGLNQTLMTNFYFASVNQTTAQNGTIDVIPSGTLASSAEASYVDSSNPNYASYQSRNILGLVKSVVLKDGNDNVVSKSETFYDEAGYEPLAYTGYNGTDYTSPGSAPRAMATTIRRYIDPAANLYLETHAQYDQFGNLRVSTNERQKQTLTDYDPASNYAYATLVTTPVPDSSGQHGSSAAFTSTTTYDNITGLVLTATDANQKTTTFSYRDQQNVADPLDRLRKITRPDGSFTTYNYHDSSTDLSGDGMYVETQTSFDSGRVMTSRQYYDKLGRSVRSFAYEGNAAATPWLVTDTYYDPLMGRVSKASNPYRTANPSSALPSTCSACTSSTYDALGRVTLVTLPDATTVQTEYQGNYTTVTDQAGKKRRQMMDGLGRLVRVDEPDASGNLGTIGEPAQATYYYYNTQGRLVHIQQGSGADLQHRYFKYDALGRLNYEFQVEPKAAPFTTSDANTASNPTPNTNWTHKLVYDEMGPNGENNKGLLTGMYDARQVHTSYAYDNLGRATQVTYSDGTPTVTNYYDQARTGYVNQGRLTQVNTDAVAAVGQTPTIPATSQVYDYDLMGRVTRQQQVVGEQSPYTLSYGYNLGGQMTSETYPSGRVVTYSYDGAARLGGVTSGATTYASDFTYDSPQALLTSLTLGNGTKESFDYYSDRMQLKEMSLTKDGTTLQRYVYQYGQINVDAGTIDATKNNGQIAQIEGYIGTQKQWQQRYSYDSLGRLTAAAEHRGDNSQLTYKNVYDYDRFGNRYQIEAHNPASNNPLGFIAVNDGDINKANNRLYSSSTFEYDEAGNVTLDNKFTGHRFEYDANNRQRKASLVDGTQAAWSVYDGAGQRVATIANNSISIMVYDAGGKLVAEYGQPISMNGTSYVFADHQGSTRVVTNQSGGVVSRQDYEPFGRELDALGMRSTDPYYAGANSARQKYAGMEKDDSSGMAHTLWRKYDQSSGRWTSPDPYGGSMSVGDPQSFNRYSYVNNDPVNQSDALGLMAGADQGYEGFEGLGGEPDFFDPHFGGPAIIENGFNGFPDRHKKKKTQSLNLFLKKLDHYSSDGLVYSSDGDDDDPLNADIASEDVVRIDSEPAYEFNATKEVTDPARLFRRFQFGSSQTCLLGCVPTKQSNLPIDISSHFANTSGLDAVQLNGSFGWGLFSGTIGVTDDGDAFGGINADGFTNILLGGITSARNGKWTTSAFSISLTGTKILGKKATRPEKIAFFTGQSFSVTGGNVLIGGLTYSNGRVGVVGGFGFQPGVSVNAGPSYSWYLGNIFGRKAPGH